ncbi:hypothetical protein [Aeromicrobium sp.]|uniref:hypothetical protein n=1 Tax=Aeromicrobium sp. TaxID=1871063 RepID=UPI003D6B0C21
MRELAEFAVPTYVIGAVAALGAGGLAAFAGQPSGWAVITGLAFGISIALFGAGYATLVALEKAPVGVFTPAAAYWFFAFPAAMLVHSIVTEWLFTGGPGLPAGPLWQFLLYNALLSMGFAIGFLWSHEYLGRHWWPRIRAHNRYAFIVVEEYKGLMTVLQERKEATARGRAEKQQQRKEAREARSAARHG